MNGTEAISIGAAQQLAIDACLACGASPAVAESLAAATLAAELAARPELGFGHLADYLDGMRQGRIDGQAEPLIEQVTPAITLVDGQRGIPQLGFDRCFEQLVETSKALGLALLVQRNAFTAGELGYFVRRLAQRGLVAIAAANSHAMMAPAAGGRIAFGTNPLAFAAPRANALVPLVIDQASSATAFVKLARSAEAGTAIPAGWALDADGGPTTDPALAVLGALLPFGGAKGANMALLVEVLAAGLTGAAWSLDAGHFRSGSVNPGTGLTIIAIDPAAIDPDFAQRLETQLHRLAARGVHVPGEKARPPGPAPLQIPAQVLAAIKAFLVPGQIP